VGRIVVGHQNGDDRQIGDHHRHRDVSRRDASHRDAADHLVLGDRLDEGDRWLRRDEGGHPDGADLRDEAGRWAEPHCCRLDGVGRPASRGHPGVADPRHRDAKDHRGDNHHRDEEH
jgi:hypothetical protein